MPRSSPSPTGIGASRWRPTQTSGEVDVEALGPAGRARRPARRSTRVRAGRASSITTRVYSGYDQCWMLAHARAADPRRAAARAAASERQRVPSRARLTPSRLPARDARGAAARAARAPRAASVASGVARAAIRSSTSASAGSRAPARTASSCARGAAPPLRSRSRASRLELARGPRARARSRSAGSPASRATSMP